MEAKILKLKKQPTEAQKAAAAEKRAELRSISKVIKQLVMIGRYDSVNEGLIDLYRENGHKEFLTFKQWKEKNMTVKKGESSFLVWAAPIHIGNSEVQLVQPEQGSEKENNFFPVCHLFSNLQVEPSKMQ